MTWEIDFYLLLQLVLQGNKLACEILSHSEFRKRGEKICNDVVNKMGGDAEDLFQNACVKVLESSHTLRPDNIRDADGFFSWFYVLVLNLRRDELRRGKNLREKGWVDCEVPADELTATAPGVSPEEECLLREFLSYVSTLPAERGRAVRLWLQQCSYREITEVLNREGIECTHVTVRNWVQNALNTFLDGGASSPPWRGN